MLARADLEALLRTRKLDRTVPIGAPAAVPVAATGMARLDAQLGGGIPRGQLSEIAGPRSAGRFSLLLAMFAAATAREELIALVDTLDMFDPESGAAAGVDLSRLLWIRGASGGAGNTPKLASLGVDRALKALNLVLQCGNFGLVSIDLAEVPPATLRHIPFTTWMRVQRVIEGSTTACVLVTPQPLARSAAGVTLAVRADPEANWMGDGARARMLAGVQTHVRIVRSRAHGEDEVALHLGYGSG